jgi:hypothetical protein
VTEREELARQELDPASVGRVLVALAALVLHHVALVVELGLGEGLQQPAHAVGLHPERELEVVGGHPLVVVGAIGIGGAVDRRADGLEGLEVLVIKRL